LDRNGCNAGEIIASLRAIDLVSSIYFDLINEASQTIGCLGADVIDLGHGGLWPSEPLRP
jgi:hypothetical protein